MPSSIRSWSTYFYDLSCKTSTSKIVKVGREPWSSGYGRRLMFRRLWVRIPSMYNGWAWFEKTKINENEAGDEPIWKKDFEGIHTRFEGIWGHFEGILLSQMFRQCLFEVGQNGSLSLHNVFKWETISVTRLDSAKFRNFGTLAKFCRTLAIGIWQNYNLLCLIYCAIGLILIVANGQIWKK